MVITGCEIEGVVACIRPCDIPCNVTRSDHPYYTMETVGLTRFAVSIDFYFSISAAIIPASAVCSPEQGHTLRSVRDSHARFAVHDHHYNLCASGSPSRTFVPLRDIVPF